MSRASTAAIVVVDYPSFSAMHQPADIVSTPASSADCAAGVLPAVRVYRGDGDADWRPLAIAADVPAGVA
jgi:hypothetical protein